jgi:hypothetical protein
VLWGPGVGISDLLKGSRHFGDGAVSQRDSGCRVGHEEEVWASVVGDDLRFDADRVAK